MKYFLVLCLLLVTNGCLAGVTFDGEPASISYGQWRELIAEDLPELSELAGHLDDYQWRVRRTLANPADFADQIIRANIHFTYHGSQQAALVVTYAFMPDVSVALYKDGKLLMLQNLNTDDNTDNQRLLRTYGMIPLPTQGAGNYQLLLKGRGIANYVISRDATLYLETDFVTRDYPINVAILSVFIGVLITCLLFCLALLFYRYQTSVLYAMTYLLGAIGIMLLSEGVLFMAVLDTNWWINQAKVFCFGLVSAGAMLYVHADMEGVKQHRLHKLLWVIGWALLVIVILNLILSYQDRPLMGLFTVIFQLSGMLCAAILLVLRARSGHWRDIIFALCFCTFFSISVGRVLIALIFRSVEITPLTEYVILDFIGAYIIVDFLWRLTKEYVRGEVTKGADIARFDLVNRFSHELRTPLNAVIGLADLLKDSKEIGQVKNYANMIHNAGYNLLGLVNDILDFSRLGTSKSELSNNPLRLDRLVTEVFYGFLPQVTGTKTFQQVLFDPGMHFFLRGDELRIKQIITNLMSNAFKYSKPNSLITMQVNQGERQGAMLEILCSISDSGRGIPAEKIKNIFEPFSQVEIEDASRLGGTGLGLAICKSLVEQMGGKISVESELGKGTTFSFNLWLQVEERSPDLRQYFSVLDGKRILLISKQTPITDQLSLPLRYWGADVEVVDNIAAAPDQIFDFIFSDTKYTCTVEDVPWINNLPAGTAVQLMEMEAVGWLNQITHPNFRVLTTPAPILDVLAAITEHITGEAIVLKESEPEQTVLVETRHRILLVDDNLVNLTIASKLLESLQAQCQTARGGEAALAALQSGDQFSLVLLDCEMPDISGFEVCRRWRQIEHQESLEHLPVVALTAHALREIRDACLQAGMDDVVYKPIGRTALVRLLNQYPGLSGVADLDQ